VLLGYGFSTGLPVSSAPVELKILCRCQEGLVGTVQSTAGLGGRGEERNECAE
jgi:hypothetical protein